MVEGLQYHVMLVLLTMVITTADDFMTPLSTPPNEPVEKDEAPKTKAAPAPDFSQLQDLSETAIRQRLYEK